jgi:protein TonB
MTAFIRTPLVLPLAAAATIGLFIGMRALIDIGDVRPAEAEELPDIVLIEMPIDEPAVRPDWLETIEEITPPPPPQQVDQDVVAVTSLDTGTSFSPPPIDPPEVEHGRGGLQTPERSPTPIVRIEPVFPARMAERGLDGQCTLVFDITPSGTTANVRVLSCSNTGFERASTTAVQRWRYDPQIQNGEAVMFRGATTQLVYRLNA